MIHNNTLEQNILGAIFCANGYGDAVDNALTQLTAEHFYIQSHKTIFKMMISLARKGINPDYNAVSTLIDTQIDKTEEQYYYDLFKYVPELYRQTTSALNLNEWVKSLEDNKVLSELQIRANEINNIISSNEDVKEKIEQAERLLSADIKRSNQTGAKHISDVALNYIDNLEKRWDNPDSVVFSTGFPAWDEILGGGLEVGLHAIAARPKMGKTELMVKMVNHFGVVRKLPILLSSLEMKDHQVMHRMVSQLGRVDKGLIKTNFKEDKTRMERTKFENAFAEYSMDCNIYIDDDFSSNFNRIRREARKVRKKHGHIGGVFVDYLQLIKSDSTAETNALRVSELTRNLKALSGELECPVIMLLQLNRDLEKRQDKKPIPADSKDSGAIEQDVDTWTALYRDSVYNENSPMGNTTEILLRLNRHGDIGSFYQDLTSFGFVDSDEYKVSQAVNAASTKPNNKTDKF